MAVKATKARNRSIERIVSIVAQLILIDRKIIFTCYA